MRALIPSVAAHWPPSGRKFTYPGAQFPAATSLTSVWGFRDVTVFAIMLRAAQGERGDEAHWAI